MSGINNNVGVDYDTALRQINALGASQAAGGATPPPQQTGMYLPAPAQDTNTAGIQNLSNKIAADYQKLDAAIQKNDVAGARKILDELKQLATEGSKLAEGTPYAANFKQVLEAVAQVEPQLPKDTQSMLVGIPGRGGRVVQVEKTEKKEHKGPFGFLGKIADKAGGLLEKVGHVVFFPLELAGKVLDPVRKAIGGVLGGLRNVIDNTVGKIPIIGQAVRFTTGLANSVVGLVDGAIQGVTHPVELIKGLGSMLWTASAFLPPFFNARTLYDMAVNGESPMESMKGAMGEGGAILKGFFQNALDDIAQGNWAGALGQVTGDIGSFFVSGGAAGAGKVAATGGKVAEISRFAKVAEAAKASEVGVKAMKVIEAAKASETGAKVMKIAKAAQESEIATKAAQLARDAELGAKAEKVVNVYKGAMQLGMETSGKIFSLGLKGNFAAWNKIGRAVNRLPGVQKVMVIGEETAAKLRNRFRPQVAEEGAAKVEGGAAPVGAQSVKPGAFQPMNPQLLQRPILEPGTKIQLPSLTDASKMREYQIMGIDNGQVRAIRMADGKVRSIAVNDMLTHNPQVQAEFFNRNIGEQVKIPSVTNPGELRTGTITGVAPDGKIYVRRNVDGHVRAVDPQVIFQHSPRYYEELMRQIDPNYVGAERLAAGETRLMNMPRLWEVTGDEGRLAINREHQVNMFRMRQAALTPQAAAHFDGLLRQASTDGERLMIQRALAAGHDVDTIATYASDMKKIAAGDVLTLKKMGFNGEWINYLQQMTPEQRVLRMSTLEGLQQHFTTSCNPTSYQIVRGELDPIYAWRGNQNPGLLVDEQSRLMALNKAPAISRNAGLWERFTNWITGKKAEGTYPQAMADQLNSLSERTGVRYEPRNLGDWVDAKGFGRSNPASRKAALQDIERSLRMGKPTEMFVQWIDGAGQAGNGGHAIGVIDTRILPNGEKQFLLHDPEFYVNGRPTPNTVWVNASDIINGNLGPKYSHGELSGYLATS
jgi:hypothetical protein